MKYLADTALLEEIFYPGMMLGGFSHAALDSGISRDNALAEESINLFSVAIKNCPMQKALNSIIGHAVSRKKANFAFVNADCLNKVWTDSDYRETLGRMAAVFADGIGVKLAAKMEGKKIVDNVNGTDLFPLLCQQAAVNQLKVFILGAKPGVAETCAEKMCARTPNLKIAGTQDGYFKEKDTHQIIDRINASGADILIVAFGAPLQEFWMDKHRNRLQVPVCIGVGGCIDFFAERISRAPTWVRNISMEWVWRLAQEPKRMWRRYIVGNPLFLYRAWKWAHLEIKMLFNRQQRVERQAVNYFATKAHSGLPRQFNTLFKLFAWKASIAGSRLIKRTMDITVATTMLLLLSPLFLILAVLIKSESKGPVLFSQMRIGLDGKPFKFWKFRSMRSDAEQTKKQLSASAMSDGVRFKIKKDPRITKVGAFIRKFSIDELPQLWNVLVGDMSLVGPRPALPQEVESYTLADKERLAVMPGITCIWQVSGRSDIPFKQQVKLDVQYRNSQSIVEDLKLLFLTVPAVILGKGAY